jgi:GntR family transcriptional repressor for pyruvate dehydrogenase complex
VTGSTSTAATVSSQIHAALRADILAGRYAAGEALPSERRLSEELATSRHVVREALKRLQQAGLVSISQGGATRVRDWRRHGGLELLLDLAAEGEAPEALHAPRAAMEMRACIGADAARRCAQRAHAAVTAQIAARAEQLAAVDDPAARNAHYEVLWDLIVDGADNIAYRLALTTLVARQRIAPIDAQAVARELEDAGAVRALARAIADGDPEGAHAIARDLLERSIP